jgi:hypothetical protein
MDNRADYLANRPSFISQHSRPALLQPIQSSLDWLQQQIPGHSIHCGLSFGGSFCQRHGGGWDIWIDVQDIAHGIAQGAGSYAGLMEAIALHEIAHIGGADEAGAWARAKTLRCKIPSPIASAREMVNASNFYMASHSLGRCPQPGEWVRLELPKPEPKPAAKPKQPSALAQYQTGKGRWEIPLAVAAGYRVGSGRMVRQVVRYG